MRSAAGSVLYRWLHYSFARADGFDEAPEGCLPSMYKLYGAVKKAYPNLRTMATFSGFSHVPTDLPVDGECSSPLASRSEALKRLLSLRSLGQYLPVVLLREAKQPGAARERHGVACRRKGVLVV